MYKRFYWICGILIILLFIFMGFLYFQDLSDRKQHEKELAAAEKLLAEKSTDVSSPSVRQPPPGETFESGHWHGNTWHKTGTSETEDDVADVAEYISPFDGAVDQLELAERIIQERPYSDAAAEARTILLYTYRENYDKAGAIAYLKKALEYHLESSLILKDLGKELWEDTQKKQSHIYKKQ